MAAAAGVLLSLLPEGLTIHNEREWIPPCPAPSLNLPPGNILSSFGSLLGPGVCLKPTSPLCAHTQKLNKALMSHPISSDMCTAGSVACLGLDVVWLENQSTALHSWGLCAFPMRHRGHGPRMRVEGEESLVGLDHTQKQSTENLFTVLPSPTFNTVSSCSCQNRHLLGLQTSSCVS